MRIQINLSSEPFRRDRPWIVASTALSIILTVTLGVLVYLAVLGRDEALEARMEVEKARAQHQAMVGEQNRLESVLRRTENAEVIERSVFLNQLLVRKGISWTRIFADLEKVVPYNVRLIRIRPNLTPQSEIFLEMQVGAPSSEPVIEMLMRLESSPQFGATHVANILPPSQTEPLYRYTVNVNYAQKL
ncbi:MAG TPA: hypothetical protein VM120_11685 [Bryobacteraceae bacterium]|nr:hypothetical protein [Bryobacteraceae bacterium]